MRRVSPLAELPGEVPCVGNDGGEISTARVPAELRLNFVRGGHERCWVAGAPGRQLSRDGVPGDGTTGLDDLLD
mgnify:CR=1 FL=1